MRAFRQAALAGVLCSALAGCAASPLLACRTNEQGMLSAELLFGRKAGDRVVVGEGNWARFVDREITPLFPDGFTVVDAAGQWRDPATNRILREPSKVVTIVFRDETGAREKLDAIAEVYKRRFNQRSVGVVIKSACASF